MIRDIFLFETKRVLKEFELEGKLSIEIFQEK